MLIKHSSLCTEKPELIDVSSFALMSSELLGFFFLEYVAV